VWPNIFWEHSMNLPSCSCSTETSLCSLIGPAHMKGSCGFYHHLQQLSATFSKQTKGGALGSFPWHMSPLLLAFNVLRLCAHSHLQKLLTSVSSPTCRNHFLSQMYF
jgi:hypothetical protein